MSTPTSVSPSGVVAAAPLLAPPTIPDVNVAALPFTPSSPAAQPLSSTAPLPPDDPILQRFYRTIQSLPQTVPIGVPLDPLAALSCLPKDLIFDGQDAWEDVVNPMLDRLLGFGMTKDDVHDLIRRGQYGMDGVFRYFHSCICDLDIHAGLLEGKIDCLVDAIKDL